MCDRVCLATGSWFSGVGVAGGGMYRGHGVGWRARVQWVMGSSVSSVSFSVVLLVSVGGMMSTIGDE